MRLGRPAGVGAIDEARFEDAARRISHMVGEFLVLWSRIEACVRAMELMRTDAGAFAPVDDVHALDLSSTRRFRERIRYAVPKHLSTADGDVRRWLLETSKLRNLLIHGGVFLYATDDGNVLPFVAHADMVATALASAEYPDVTRVSVPNHANSAAPNTTLSPGQVEELIADARAVLAVFVGHIERVHAEARRACPPPAADARSVSAAATSGAR